MFLNKIILLKTFQIKKYKKKNFFDWENHTQLRKKKVINILENSYC